MSRVEELVEALASDRFTRKQLADGSGVILDLEHMNVLTLNETGMFLLEEIASGVKTVDQLSERLTSVFDVDRDTAATDIEDLLSALEGVLKTQTR